MPIKNLTDWAEDLDQLILDGMNAVQAGNAKTMVAAQNALLKFVDDSPDFADVLDQQANLAILDIDLANSRDAAASLRSRRQEIGRIRTSLEGMAGELQKDASTLRLERITGAVEAVSKTVTALKEARDALKSTGTDQQLRKAIDEAITGIQDVRSRLETA